MKFIIVSLLLFLATTKTVLAHCPLCTFGAAGAAIVASWFGISTAPIGVFIGAFGLAAGLWGATYIKKQLVPHQEKVLGVLSFLSVVWPLKSFLTGYSSVYMRWLGEDGRTYVINNFLLGSVIGALLLLVAPNLSRWITRMRGSTMPYQGMMITFGALLLAAVILEILI